MDLLLPRAELSAHGHARDGAAVDAERPLDLRRVAAAPIRIGSCKYLRRRSTAGIFIEADTSKREREFCLARFLYVMMLRTHLCASVCVAVCGKECKHVVITDSCILHAESSIVLVVL